MNRNEMHEALERGGWLALDGGPPGTWTRYAPVVDGAAEIANAMRMDKAYAAMQARQSSMTPAGALSAAIRSVKPSAQTFYVTTFCNSSHNLKTGRPIGHECYILDPRKLALEAEGRINEIKGGMPLEPRRLVRGRPQGTSPKRKTRGTTVAQMEERLEEADRKARRKAGI